VRSPSGIFVNQFDQELRCERCAGSLGSYHVTIDDGGYAVLEPLNQPRGMVEWNGEGKQPRMFIMVEPWGPTGRSALRYRWGCGACRRVTDSYRVDTLARRFRDNIFSL
jgi:hypothetical protein